MRDPVLAAQEDALRVDVLHAVPGFRLGVEDRRVVRRHDPRVVVEDVDAAVTLGGRVVHRRDRARVSDVDLLEERLAALGRGPLARLGADVRDADARPFL